MQQIIHQALFGYSAGHHLISASCPLSGQELKILEPLSDLSGSGMPPAFDGYLTGYYASSLDCYALCKTWFAREMPRPGCVWTHVLLIPADISQSISAMLTENAFIRPDISIPDWKMEYAKTKTLSNNKDEKYTVEVEEGSLAHSLLSKLLTINGPVVIFAGECTAYNEAILTLLRALPLRFFKDISFCTGAFSNRMIQKTPLSLQIVPNEISKIAWRASGIDFSFCFGDELQQSMPAYSSKKICEAIHLLASLEMRDISRKNLSMLLYVENVVKTGDYSDVMSAFSEMVALFGDTCGQLAATVMAQYFSLAFKDAERLDYEALASLCTAKMPIWDWDIGITDEEINCVTHKLMQQDLETVCYTMDRLFAEPLNELGERTLQALANSMEAEAFCGYIARNSDKAGTLVSLNQELALCPDLWKLPYGTQCDVLNAMSYQYRETKTSDDSFYMVLLITVYQNSRESLSDRIYQGFSTLAIDAYFEWAQRDDVEPDRKWREICRHEPTRCVLMLCDVSKPAVFLNVIGALDPYEPILQTVHIDVWEELYDRFCANGSAEIQKVYAQFLTPIILLGSTAFPKRLAEFAFTQVHQLLAESRMDDQSWGKLSDILPELFVFSMWDRCKRLRKAAKNKNYHIDFKQSYNDE